MQLSAFILKRQKIILNIFIKLIVTIPKLYGSFPILFILRFDTAVRQALERELGVSLEDHQWIQAQATIPVSMGGLGMRRVETHSPGACVASLRASCDIMEEIVG